MLRFFPVFWVEGWNGGVVGQREITGGGVSTKTAVHCSAWVLRAFCFFGRFDIFFCSHHLLSLVEDPCTLAWWDQFGGIFGERRSRSGTPDVVVHSPTA